MCIQTLDQTMAHMPDGDAGRENTSDRRDIEQGYEFGDTYEITIKGYLDSRWEDWFGGFSIRNTADGNTLLSGSLPDQSALHGLLEKVRDLNLILISVLRADTLQAVKQHQIETPENRGS